MLINKINPLIRLQTSLWPLFVSLNLFSLFINLIMLIRHKIEISFIVLNFTSLLLVLILWWVDMYKESFLGFHTHKLESCMRLGVMFFILSEVFFFVSFFWAFFDASLVPTVDIGIAWPPKGVLTLSIYSVPLLNTLLLLRRGLTVTWVHHSLLNNLYFKRIIRLNVTVFLGIYFLYLQYEEYSETSFSIRDRTYGRTFFMATGFHGFHVMLGTCILFIAIILICKGRVLFNHHFSFEFAAWYWHFVDVVWLFLFVSVYWWGRLV